MTWSRVAEFYIEGVIQGAGAMRVAEEYVEAVVQGAGSMRTAELYVEAVVKPVAPAAWIIGSIAMRA